MEKKKPGPKPDPTKPYSKYRPPRQRKMVRRTHCPYGHEYSPENSSVKKNGTVNCKTCARERAALKRLGQKLISEKAPRPNTLKTNCPRGHQYTEENTYVGKSGSRFCRACQRANRFVQRLKQYNLTLDQYVAMLMQQEDRCAICTTLIGGNDGVTPCVDHDHSCCPGRTSCGECVRGLLCKSCNTLIGYAKDSQEILRAAVNYLEK